jgi:hypothetical protein
VVDATFNRGFSYDDLNRLKTANTTATPLWGKRRTEAPVIAIHGVNLGR